MTDATMNFTALDLAMDTLHQQQNNVKSHIANELVNTLQHGNQADLTRLIGTISGLGSSFTLEEILIVLRQKEILSK